MIEIDGHTRLCALIGNPVEHTLSPLIHNTLAADLGHNLAYVPLRVDGTRVREAIEGAYALDVLGLNVTVPHKSAVIPCLKGIDRTAERIGAVNTLVRREDLGGYYGYNTDITGLKRAIESDGVTLGGAHVVMTGAGGAARAAAFLCGEEGALSLWIINRTREKAQELAKEVSRFYPETKVRALTYDELDQLPQERMIALQCTSVGLHPHCEETPVEAEDFFRRIDYAFDLIYRPEETAFLRRVRQAGGRTANGLAMLLWQGIAAYEYWNDVAVEPQEAQKLLKQLKEAIGQ